jgi:hypothetical protein
MVFRRASGGLPLHGFRVRLAGAAIALSLTDLALIMKTVRSGPIFRELLHHLHLLTRATPLGRRGKFH